MPVEQVQKHFQATRNLSVWQGKNEKGEGDKSIIWLWVYIYYAVREWKWFTLWNTPKSRSLQAENILLSSNKAMQALSCATATRDYWAPDMCQLRCAVSIKYTPDFKELLTMGGKKVKYLINNFYVDTWGDIFIYQIMKYTTKN